MAATAPASVVDSSYTVPDWVERNSNLFKTPPPGFDASNIRGSTPVDMEMVFTMAASVFSGESQLAAGVGAAELTDDGMGNINLPTSPQPGDYWRNVQNHGNILVTLITTARHKSGFIPSLSSNHFTSQQAAEYAHKFSNWMKELQSYSPYISLVDTAQHSAQNNSIDCNVIIREVTSFVVGLAGLTGTALTATTLRIENLIKSAANFVARNGTSVNAGFQLETTQTNGARDPTQPITFASTFMRRTGSGKSVSEHSSITLSGFVYRLNSSAIILMADHLAAGSTVWGARQYRDYINGPINSR